MCRICVEYQKDLLTFEEAMLNTEEMAIDDPHKEEVKMLLLNFEHFDMYTDDLD